MKSSLGFRAWFYFRQGWGIYFAFILAALNTLTVTYFLAIENYPFLKTIFPSFEQYILIVVSIGVPLLIAIGYIHYKRTIAFKSEMDILVESNPYMRRTIVNTEVNFMLTLQLANLLLSLSKNKKPTDEDIEKISQIQKELADFAEKRTISNMMDLKFLKERIFKI